MVIEWKDKIEKRKKTHKITDVSENNLFKLNVSKLLMCNFFPRFKLEPSVFKVFSLLCYLIWRKQYYISQKLFLYLIIFIISTRSGKVNKNWLERKCLGSWSWGAQLVKFLLSQLPFCCWRKLSWQKQLKGGQVLFGSQSIKTDVMVTRSAAQSQDEDSYEWMLPFMQSIPPSFRMVFAPQLTCELLPHRLAPKLVPRWF